jgi:uroporphyrinogen decarboxylase
MKRMTTWERIEAALHGAEVDRIPVGMWKHWHLQDRAPGRLAELNLALQRQFDTDLIKLTPGNLTYVQDWGATIKFGTHDDQSSLAVQPAVASAAQWPGLQRLDVAKGALGRELETIRLTAAGVDGQVPVLMTIFSPLTVAYKLSGDSLSGERVVEDLRQSPRQLHAGLARIADVLREYVAACLQAGANGFFFATQLAYYELLSREEYQEFGVAYDLRVLEAMQGGSRITMLHLCKGRRLMLDLLHDYPVHAISWSHRTSQPSLAEARQLTEKALATGVSLQALHEGKEADVLAEAREAIARAGRKAFILAPACVIRATAPDANLTAMRRAVEE